MQCRSFLRRSLVAAPVRILAEDLATAAAAAAEPAHRAIWRHLIPPHGLMIDFTDLDGSVRQLTPEECRARGGSAAAACRGRGARHRPPHDTRLSYSQFFRVESAWWRLKAMS